MENPVDSLATESLTETITQQAAQQQSNQGWWSQALGGLSSKFSGFINGVGDVGKAMGEGLSGIVGSLGSLFSSGAGAAVKWGKVAFNAVVSYFGANAGGGSGGGGTASSRTGIADVAYYKDGGIIDEEIKKYAKGGIIDEEVEKYAGGGMIRGPGTGTSDSIHGVILDAKGIPRKRIMVSDGEAILNAKATRMLGANFINEVNSGQVLKFATGGLIGHQGSVASASSTVQQEMAAATATAPASGEQATAVSIVNMVDKDLFEDFMASDAGDKTLINRMRKNASAIRRVLN
jgi:hypothetical protein